MATTPRASTYVPIPVGTVFRAIAVRNPHAVRIALNVKRIETRCWPTPYRGAILICSTVRPRVYPNGYALCVAELVDCRRMTAEDEVDACVALYDAYSWVLENVRPITPFGVQGRQRFFWVPVPSGINFLPRFAAPHQGELFHAPT
jgi:hypothetical protein